MLVAALLHAIWNAMLHGNRDRQLSMAWMSISIAAVATCAVVILPWPTSAAWPYIVASGLVHVLYNAALVRAYGNSDLAQSYPIARGSSPLLVTLGAAIFAHEPISALHAFGVAMVSCGIMSLALQGTRLSRSGAAAALTVGVLIGVYSVIDGIGVRTDEDHVLSYTAWMFLFYWGTPVLYVAKNGLSPLMASFRSTPSAVASSLGGGVVSIAAYGIVIWAMQSGAMGAVSALRETSVVFATLIGRIFLHEPVSGQRWLACVVIATGAICLGL